MSLSFFGIGHNHLGTRRQAREAQLTAGNVPHTHHVAFAHIAAEPFQLEAKDDPDPNSLDWGGDGLHGNMKYGEIMLRHVLTAIAAEIPTELNV